MRRLGVLSAHDSNKRGQFNKRIPTKLRLEIEEIMRLRRKGTRTNPLTQQNSQRRRRRESITEIK